MRTRYALVALPVLAFVGCVRQPPVRAPQSPAATPAAVAEPLPGVLFLINGRALAAGHALAELDQRYIISVDHLIGPAAQPYLRPRFREVYLIVTRDTLTAHGITVP